MSMLFHFVNVQLCDVKVEKTSVFHFARVIIIIYL